MKPTLLGNVGAVSGTTVHLRQSPAVASGIAIIGGKTYRVGQVGSFVRIPQGYSSLFGIVTEVGATAVPESTRGPNLDSDRWMTIQLVGESIGSSFERGISQFPNVNDEAHLVTEEDLGVIYGAADDGHITIGHLANADGIPVKLDLNKLITRHSALLGSTGSGKSTTVASLLQSIATGGKEEDEVGFPNARIILLDIHGEYARALTDVSTVFSVGGGGNQRPLYIPFWALDPTELLTFIMGKLDDKQVIQILDKILSYKQSVASASGVQGITVNSMTASSPVPFSLKTLWFDLLKPEITTWKDQSRTIPAELYAGNAETLAPPRYEVHGPGSTAPFINQTGVLNIRRQLDQMRSRLLDRQYDFLLHPGKWEPSLDGQVCEDLPELLRSWLGNERPISILDLSGIPSSALGRLIGTILNIIYEGLFWGRFKSEGGIERPLLVVMEEAHRYLGKDAGGPAREIVQRIVKEGRKFGIGSMIVSQRPSEVDDTILSQCGTFISLRLSNSVDRARVQSTLPDNLANIVDFLPALRIGEAIITGEAAKLPVRCRISLPRSNACPDSGDPAVAGAWKSKRRTENYERIAAAWRAQDPAWTAVRPPRTRITDDEDLQMERDAIESSALASVGYEPETSTLEVEFRSGGIYQYYDVPSSVYELMQSSESKGRFFHVYIKNAYAFSKL